MTGPNERKVVCLKLADWPEQDQRAWTAALCEDDLLDDPGPLTHLRPSTIGKLRCAYGRWLWFLSTRGLLSDGVDPASRITRRAIAEYLEDLRDRNASVTVAQRILDLERVVLAFAPEGDWHWLRRLINRLFLRARPTRDKLARMRPASEVFAAALVMLAEAETGDFTSLKKRAAMFRDALILAILASRAPRVGTLAMIELDRHLCRAGCGWTLRFEGSETKNGDPLELPLPEELWQPLERYLAHWRLVLLHDRMSAHLWISAYGQPIAPDRIDFIEERPGRCQTHDWAHTRVELCGFWQDIRWMAQNSPTRLEEKEQMIEAT